MNFFLAIMEEDTLSSNFLLQGMHMALVETVT
jgi:hypothetical protein